MLLSLQSINCTFTLEIVMQRSLIFNRTHKVDLSVCIYCVNMQYLCVVLGMVRRH